MDGCAKYTTLLLKVGKQNQHPPFQQRQTQSLILRSELDFDIAEDDYKQLPGDRKADYLNICKRPGTKGIDYNESTPWTTLSKKFKKLKDKKIRSKCKQPMKKHVEDDGIEMTIMRKTTTPVNLNIGGDFDKVLRGANDGSNFLGTGSQFVDDDDKSNCKNSSSSSSSSNNNNNNDDDDDDDDDDNNNNNIDDDDTHVPSFTATYFARSSYQANFAVSAGQNTDTYAACLRTRAGNNFAQVLRLSNYLLYVMVDVGCKTSDFPPSKGHANEVKFVFVVLTLQTNVLLHACSKCVSEDRRSSFVDSVIWNPQELLYLTPEQLSCIFPLLNQHCSESCDCVHSRTLKNVSPRGTDQDFILLHTVYIYTHKYIYHWISFLGTRMASEYF
jgi:hypothetical protein